MRPARCKGRGHEAPFPPPRLIEKKININVLNRRLDALNSKFLGEESNTSDVNPVKLKIFYRLYGNLDIREKKILHTFK